jgi:hypothetical protein
VSRTKSLIEPSYVPLAPGSCELPGEEGVVEPKVDTFADDTEYEEFQPLSLGKETAFQEALMTWRLALQLDPSQCILEDDVDLSKTINLVRPVILSQSLGERAQALVTHGLADEPPTAAEVRLIAAAMQKMEI